MDIHAAKKKHEKYLKSLPNVTALGIGPKVSGGRETGQTAIKVFVSRKAPLGELANDQIIPNTLEGYPTDVEVIGSLRARKQT